MIKKYQEKKSAAEERKKQKEDKEKDSLHQLQLTGFFSPSKPLELARITRISNAIIDFMVANCVPFSLIEDPFFRSLLHELEPGKFFHHPYIFGSESANVVSVWMGLSVRLFALCSKALSKGFLRGVRRLKTS